MKGIACRDCLYATELIAGKIYNCRVNPPVMDKELSWDGGNGLWPTVEATDWCGRWTPRERMIALANRTNTEPQTTPPRPPLSAP